MHRGRRSYSLILIPSIFVFLALITFGFAQGDNEKAATVTGITVPEGYRSWAILSASHRTDKGEIRLILGNDVAIDAAKNNVLPFPDGAILAKLAYTAEKSDEWNEALVPGNPQRQEFMVKNSKKYSSTGGWGFGRFVNGKPVGDETLYGTCFPCHEARVKNHDYVFTRFAP